MQRTCTFWMRPRCALQTHNIWQCWKEAMSNGSQMRVAGNYSRSGTAAVSGSCPAACHPMAVNPAFELDHACPYRYTWRIRQCGQPWQKRCYVSHTRALLVVCISEITINLNGTRTVSICMPWCLNMSHGWYSYRGVR